MCNIAQMHEGEIVRDLLVELGMSKEKLAAKIGKHRNSVGQWLQEDQISVDKLIMIGKALRYDLTSKIPRLKIYPNSSELHFFNEDPAPYFKEVKKVQEMIADEKQLLANADLEIRMLNQRITDLEKIINNQEQLLTAKETLLQTQLSKEE
jgi:transcriptional regulator with XRE-family HTH domain